MPGLRGRGLRGDGAAAADRSRSTGSHVREFARYYRRTDHTFSRGETTMLKPFIIACAACFTAACTTTAPVHSQLDTAQLQSDLLSETAQPRYRCVSATGTRIIRPGQCVASPGRVYTQGELGFTGALSTAE